jgi:hypothetical protein
MKTCKTCCFNIKAEPRRKCLLTLRYTADDARACEDYDDAREPYPGFFRECAGMKEILRLR